MDEDKNSSRGSDGSASGEDSQSEGPFALDGDDDDESSTSETPLQNDEEEAIPSRFSLKPRQGPVPGKTTIPLHASSPRPPTFAGMGVSSSLVSAMNKMSIHTPTEIQAACIPPLLDGTYLSCGVPSLTLKILVR
jgi:ATP-dependent RNA helicase DDX49/DBP8